MDTIIEKSPNQLFKSLCILVANKSWQEARDVAEQLANKGAQGAWLDLAFDLADGLKNLFQVSEDLFSLGNAPLSTTEIENIIESREWVSQQLGTKKPTLLIDVCAEGTPLHAITGINGFGFIAASNSSLLDKSLLVHEITHCSLMSRAIFLDEGLATLLQHRYNNSEDVFKKQLYWNRPSLAGLIEADWSNDPYFSKVTPITNNSSDLSQHDLRVHELAAYMVDQMVQKTSLATIVSTWPTLKSQLREGKTAEVIKKLFSIDLWEYDHTFLKVSSPDITSPSDNDSLMSIATKALLNEDKKSAELWLPIARITAFENDKALEALIMLLITLGNNREDPVGSTAYRSEAMVAIHWASTRNIDEISKKLFNAYTYVLKLRSAGHAIALRTNGMKAHQAFQNLLENHPNNSLIIITSAKSQIRSVHDFMPIKDWREKLEKIKSEGVYANAADTLLNHSRFL